MVAFMCGQRSKPAFSMMRAALLLAVSVLSSTSQSKEELFKDQIGAIPVGTVADTATIKVPFITWGGDVATFHANGGLKTARGTVFSKQGLNLELTPGDDFNQQVKDYIAGKSPFLRGTFSMIGLASEIIGQDERTKGVVILQLTWSAGDHLVGRDTIKTTNDLKGKTILLQRGGPHIGMLDDILRINRLTWDDINVVWTKDLTGTPDCPAEMFKKDAKYDACFAISPDMTALTGGLDKSGDGANGTVKGARVVDSTAYLSHSIADVYVCRKDFYDAHQDLVMKFVAGYLKGCEELLDIKKKRDAKDAPATEEYNRLLTMTQNIYSKAVIPTLDDADGLISDANFVLYDGNKEFFTDTVNQSNFKTYNEQAMQLVTSRGYASKRIDLLPSGLDYASPLLRNYLTVLDRKKKEFDGEAVFKSIKNLKAQDADNSTIHTFSIYFQPDDDKFDASKYAADFARVVEEAEKYGNAAVVVRGHADAIVLIKNFMASGKQLGMLKGVGAQLTLRGEKFNPKDTATMIKEIEAGTFDQVGGTFDFKKSAQYLLALSQKRAASVRDKIVQYAATKNLKLDPNQIAPIGVSCSQPIFFPSGEVDGVKSRRVEFRLMKIPAELRKTADRDF